MQEIFPFSETLPSVYARRELSIESSHFWFRLTDQGLEVC